jgi:hypothetical protein
MNAELYSDLIPKLINARENDDRSWLRAGTKWENNCEDVALSAGQGAFLEGLGFRPVAFSAISCLFRVRVPFIGGIAL